MKNYFFTRLLPDVEEKGEEMDKITVAKAAKILKKSKQFVREGIKSRKTSHRYSSKKEFCMDISYITKALL